MKQGQLQKLNEEIAKMLFNQCEGKYISGQYSLHKITILWKFRKNKAIKRDLHTVKSSRGGGGV